MPKALRKIDRSDILPIPEYKEKRDEIIRTLMEHKKLRRLSIGPHASIYFESFETMHAQVQEMLYIEMGGDAQLVDELAAYNPMIPNGSELTATLMFEIEDPVQRDKLLRQLSNIQDHVSIQIGSETIKAVPEGDVERTRDDGKTSSVHFLHFPFNEAQIATFMDLATQVSACITHPDYGHMALLSEATREALAEDFQ